LWIGYTLLTTDRRKPFFFLAVAIRLTDALTRSKGIAVLVIASGKYGLLGQVFSPAVVVNNRNRIMVTNVFIINPVVKTTISNIKDSFKSLIVFNLFF